LMSSLFFCNLFA